MHIHCKYNVHCIGLSKLPITTWLQWHNQVFTIAHNGERCTTRSQAVTRIADWSASQQIIGSNQRLLLNSCISAVFEILRSKRIYWGHKYDLSGSRDVIGHVTIWFLVGHFLLVVLWNKTLSLTVSEIFNAMVDMTFDTWYDL